MKESRGIKAPSNASDTQNARNDRASDMLTVKLRDLDGSRIVLAMRSDSVNSSPKAQFPSNPTEKYTTNPYREGDCEHATNMTDLDGGERGNDGPPKTVAERSVEKRKMKRFR
jgi:hypothetical protein